MSVKFESRDLGKARIERELKKARKLVGLVGIPSDAERSANNPNFPLASIALVMEKGSPVNKVPPRPFMKQTRERYEKSMLRLARKLLKGISNGVTTAKAAVSEMTVKYEGYMKSIFLRGSFKSNAEITKEGGWMRNKVSGKPFFVKGKKSSRPLIADGTLRSSIKGRVVSL